MGGLLLFIEASGGFCLPVVQLIVNYPLNKLQLQFLWILQTYKYIIFNL